MNKTAITIIASILLMIFVSCSDINPFFAAGVVPGGNWIYFSEGNIIKKMRLDGSEVESVFTIDTSEIRRIQLDSFRQKIYISSHIAANDEKICEYNLDGSGVKELVNKGAMPILDMKIDSAAGMLYYAYNETMGEIHQIDLESGSSQKIFTNTAAFGGSFSMSPDFDGNLYYTDSASPYKLNISTQISNMLTLVPAPTVSGGVTFDRDNNYLYLYDANAIKKINLSNSTISTIFSGVGYIYQKNMELSRIENKLFLICDMGPNYRLLSINLDGSDLKEIYPESPGFSAFDILSK